MQVAIRPARPEDASAIAELHLEAKRKAMPYLPELHTDEDAHAWIREEVLPRQEVYVALEDDAVVGFASLRGDVLELLYVLPRAQGRGVGSALLGLAKELRPGGFRLWVFQRNTAARRFYEARGLRLGELTDGAANEEQEPDAWYEWRGGR